MPAVEKIRMIGTLKELDFTWLHTLHYNFLQYLTFDIPGGGHSLFGTCTSFWQQCKSPAFIPCLCKNLSLRMCKMCKTCVSCVDWRATCQSSSKQASPAFSTFQREPGPRNSLFSGRSLARHHVNDYVSLSDGPLTSSRSYSRLHAAVERQKCDKRPGFGGKKLSWTNVITRFFSFVRITVRSFVLDHLVHHQHHWLALAKSLNRIFWNTTHD